MYLEINEHNKGFSSDDGIGKTHDGTDTQTEDVTEATDASPTSTLDIAFLQESIIDEQELPGDGFISRVRLPKILIDEERLNLVMDVHKQYKELVEAKTKIMTCEAIEDVCDMYDIRKSIFIRYLEYGEEGFEYVCNDLRKS